VADRQCGEPFALGIEESIGADHEPACPQLEKCCEDCIEVAFGARVQDTKLRAAVCRSLDSAWALGLAGLTRSAMTVAAGTTLCSSSSAFGATSTANAVTPVRLPPGRFRLATRPSLTGSRPVVKTIGTVAVAALAAGAAGLVPTAITAT